MKRTTFPFLMDLPLLMLAPIMLLMVAGTPTLGQALTWVRTGGPPGGLGYDIRYKFDAIDTWYVTDAFAGVHVSTDNGVTWQPANTGILSELGPTGDWIPIFCLTVDPLNPQIVWIGTQWTGHIYKSTDGGHTWIEKDEGVTITYDMLSFRGFTVDPRSSDIVYAMGETTSNTPYPDVTGGQVYKTVDGGDHWALIWDGGMPSALTRYLWIDPRNPDVLYVSTGIFDRGAVGSNPIPDLYDGLGILKSTDGGQTWHELNQTNGLEMLHIGSLYMHPDDPDALLAAAGHLLPLPALEHILQQGYSPAGIYRTTDGGEHWVRVLEAPLSRPNEAFSSVEYCTSHPNVAYAGSDKAVYRSEDGGETWALVSGGDKGWGPPGVLANWPIDMQCDPENPTRIYANNYLGGNFLSEDGGRSWENVSRGYTGAIMIDVAVDPTEPARIYAAGRTGIWRSDNGGNAWYGLRYGDAEQISANEWYAIEIDPSDPSHILGGGTNGITMVASRDGGRNWQYQWSMWELWPPEVELQPTEFMVPTSIVFAPSHPTTVYAGGAHSASVTFHGQPEAPGIGPLISQDGGQTWHASPDASVSDLSVFDLAVDPTDEHVAYMATENGLYKTPDGGTTWSLLQTASEGTMVRAVAVRPADPEYVLAGVEGLGVYISTDGGQTWQAGVAGLEPNSSIHDIVFDPTNPQRVYASDYFSGVYRSADGGQSWQKINDGLRTRTAMGLTLSADGQHLYAATNGEGVFRLDLNGLPPDEATAVEPGDTPITDFRLDQNYPNPFNPETAIHYTLRRQAPVRLRVLNLLGMEVVTLVDQQQGPGSYTVRWQGTDRFGLRVASGVYLYQLEADGFVDVKKMLFIK